MLQNGLTLLNVTSYLQRLIIGLVIILAVFLDQLRRGEVSTRRLKRLFLENNVLFSKDKFVSLANDMSVS